MKKTVWWILIVLLVTVCNVQGSTNKYLYTESNFRITDPWYLNIIHARNFINEHYTTLMLTPQRPLDLPWHFTLDCGPVFRSFQYDEWNENMRRNIDKEKQFLELFLAPEIDLNWRFIAFRARDEFRANYNGDFHDNLFFAQIRAYPHRLLWGDISYSTFDAYDLGGIRIEGISSELRTRIGTVLLSAIECGLQFTSAYYRSQEKIWESEYRPDGGVFFRITCPPLWFELSWERLTVKEKDLRIGKILPTFDQDRVFIACGFTQDPKYVRR